MSQNRIYAPGAADNIGTDKKGGPGVLASGLLKSAGIVTLGAFLGRLLGFGRETALAARFGAGAAVDAFQNAALLPVTLFMPLAGALASALIPVHARRSAEGGSDGVLRTANTLLNATLLTSSAAAALTFLLAPRISALVAPGFDAAGRELVTALLRWMAPSMAFLAVAAVLTGLLQARDRFLLPAMATLPMNGAVIAAILGFPPAAGIRAAAIGTLAGAAGYLLVHLPGLRGTGYRYRPVLDLGDPGFRLSLRLLGPLLLTTAAGQVALMVGRVLASGLPEGSISYLNYAARLAELPVSLFAGALTTVIFPALARQAVAGEEAFRRSLAGGARMMLWMMAPLAAGTAVLREPLVRLLFQRGAFDAADTAATAAALLYLALGIVPLSVGSVWGKGFYALGDTRSPFLAALVNIAAAVGFSLLLIGPLAHAGLALASALAQSVALTINVLLMRRRIGALGGGLPAFTLKVLGASAAMSAVLAAADGALAGAGWLAGGALATQVIRLAILAAAGAAAYGAAALLLRLEEAAILLGAAARAFSRLALRARGCP